MDFFSAQEFARKRTKWMVLLFILSVLCITVALYGVVLFGYYSLFADNASHRNQAVTLYHPDLFLATLVGVSGFICFCSLHKIRELRQGGAYVARSLGGRLVSPKTKDPDERKLLNVVEEMAIASGVPVPQVFLMPQGGINGFAAGYTTSDAVISLTRGAIEKLNRDELQAVVAHEFSHILNGDMRLNIRLMGVLFGLLAIAVSGRSMLRVMSDSSRRRSRSSRKGEGGGLIIIFIIAFLVMCIGYIGVFFGRLIQSAISRQREFLADAAAVQFTRNPLGIADALKKIGGHSHRSLIRHPHAEEAAHIFFATALSGNLSSPFATHPPLEQRIRAIEPNWDGKFIFVPVKKKEPPKTASSGQADKDFIRKVGTLTAAAILSADQMQGAIASEKEAISADPAEARAAILALQADAAEELAPDAAQAIVRKALGPDMAQRTAQWTKKFAGMPNRQRFALLQHCLSAGTSDGLKPMEALIACMTELAEADQSITPEELAILRSAKLYLKRKRNPARRFRPMPPAQLAPHIERLLSALSYAGSASGEALNKGFTAGAKQCNRYLLQRARRLPREAISLQELESTLETLADLPPPQKKIIFEGALAVIQSDGRVEKDEYALIRCVAISLDLPLPPV
ncbi:M48 family metallopeptidase [Coraliomargarita parva]|uniref:M48 family metallopeptidase n=1 Tax=Coraliomargarita parva TaxID=3014050 RepID=UPI0022B584F5|nr:M48 family metallopeptidase [Coraliomargarita parva]